MRPAPTPGHRGSPRRTRALAWLASAALLGALVPMAGPVAAADPVGQGDAGLRAASSAPDRVDGGPTPPSRQHKPHGMDSRVDAIASTASAHGATKAVAAA